TMQPPFTAGIDQPIAHQGLQNVLPARTFARIGQARRKEKIEFELPIEMTGQKAGAPLPRPMQLHLVEPHLHAIGFGMVRHGPFGRKQRQLTMMSAVFVEGLDDPTPGVALAVVDLTKIYPDSLKSREKFLAVSDWTDSVARMIQSGFLSEEDRMALTALARDGSSPCRMTRRANALVLLDEGWICQQVAHALLLDDDTIRSWRKLFEQRGIEGLTSFDVGGSASYLSVK